MTKMTPPMRITFHYNGRAFAHGHIVARTNDLIQFVFRYAPNSTPTLLADAADEGAMWVRGWLRWWWPPDWTTKKAMLAASAMGSGGVRLAETAESKAAKRVSRMVDEAMHKVSKILAGLGIR